CRAREQREKQIADSALAAQNLDTNKNHTSDPSAFVPLPTHDAEDPAQIQSNIPISPTFTFASPDGQSNPTPSTPDHPKKRKRPKKNKSTNAAPEPEDVLRLGLGGYDPTLLAVVGVLEAVKWERNVAGWMRQGGLAKVDVDVDVGAEEEGEEGEGHGEGREGHGGKEGHGEGREGSGLVEVENGSVEEGQAQSAESQGDGKRRRVSGEEPRPGATDEETSPVAGSATPRSPYATSSPTTPTTSPPTSVSPPATSTATPSPSPDTRRTTAKITAPEQDQIVNISNEAATITATNVGDTGQWFEDPAALRYWVRQGMRALESLGITVVGGVVGQ
ncbi:hypothetical protein C0991_009630, partial [Blastosporella zonata]